MNIEQEIRQAYTGIIPEEQIQATIEWWRKKELAFKEDIIKKIQGLQEWNNGKWSAYNKGIQDAVNVIKDNK